MRHCCGNHCCQWLHKNEDELERYIQSGEKILINVHRRIQVQFFWRKIKLNCELTCCVCVRACVRACVRIQVSLNLLHKHELTSIQFPSSQLWARKPTPECHGSAEAPVSAHSRCLPEMLSFLTQLFLAFNHKLTQAFRTESKTAMCNAVAGCGTHGHTPHPAFWSTSTIWQAGLMEHSRPLIHLQITLMVHSEVTSIVTLAG